MIKLVSLNIERSKHLDRVVPFLAREAPDVVCLQELMAYDIPRFEKALGAPCRYSPVTIHDAEGKPGPFGQGIFSRLPVSDFSEHYYWGAPGELSIFDFTDAATKHGSETHLVSACDVDKNGERFRIATTHFTWTPDGQPDDFQRADMRALLAVLAGLDDFALCGDFNAPRGGEIFAALASRYADAIPPGYRTSLDLDLHRAGKTDAERLSTLMVDGLFTTPGLIAREVRLEFGVSDHAAIVAALARAVSIAS